MKYTIPFACVSKSRPRVTRNGQHTYMPKPYQEWRTAVRNEVTAQGIDQALFDAKLRLGAIMSFKGLGRGDIDNYVGGIMDACNGLLYADDKQIKELHAVVLTKQKYTTFEFTLEAIDEMSALPRSTG